MFTLQSPAFAHEGPIPSRHTCDGPDLSPPLAWANPPSGTRTFALLVDDPDAPDPAAPRRVWVHWIRYDIPAATAAMAEGEGNRLPASGGRETLTDADAPGWHGPCPPIGRHRYYFRLFALDTEIGDLGRKARRKDFEAAIEGHVLGTAILMGTYLRAGRA
jgi:Raf kinase inhibitor-like YbhB/YbcL family protein